MIYQEGFAYHIKDEYFEKVQDDKLMQNKENGTYRPTFFCLRDPKTSLLWMVPLSSRIEKFKEIHNKQVSKYDAFGIESYLANLFILFSNTSSSYKKLPETNP